MRDHVITLSLNGVIYYGLVGLFIYAVIFLLGFAECDYDVKRIDWRKVPLICGTMLLITVMFTEAAGFLFFH